MPHVLVVANSWQAHESQKRAWPHGTNTILALWLIQQISQKLYDDVEAEATGTAYAADEYSTFLSLDVYSLVVTCSFRYSTCPVAGYYSTFPLLDVSTERHYLQFYSTFPLPVISITRRFSAPTFFAHRLISLYHNHKCYDFIKVKLASCHLFIDVLNTCQNHLIL